MTCDNLNFQLIYHLWGSSRLLRDLPCTVNLYHTTFSISQFKSSLLLIVYRISNSSKQIKVFELMFGSSRFQAVLHYYSGFTKLANPAIQDFVSTYARQKSSIEYLLPLLHCFYEAQEPSLCNLVFTRECIELDSVFEPSRLFGYWLLRNLTPVSTFF